MKSTWEPLPLHVHTQSCPTLCNPMDCSPPGSSVHGILQARILEWVAISSSRGSFWPRKNPHVLCLLHWQVDSLPRCHMGSPENTLNLHNIVCQIYLKKKKKLSHAIRTHLYTTLKSLYSTFHMSLTLFSAHRLWWDIVLGFSPQPPHTPSLSIDSTWNQCFPKCVPWTTCFGITCCCSCC